MCCSGHSGHVLFGRTDHAHTTVEPLTYCYNYYRHELLTGRAGENHARLPFGRTT